jgi:hypothetical protein
MVQGSHAAYCWTTHICLYLGKFATKFENISEHESGTWKELFGEKKPEVENLVKYLFQGKSKEKCVNTQ